ncbi:flavodoxin reductase [Pedobacter changchengzhani]|uniref:Flavodoxin reductase n=1 Tax=Pedobacter changchengzhani TaxID=2529274 RepID=A0A4R5MK48_9SPHI|nr:flavodoxin reductase [Pedobacter changchengzhani]TDG35575.1 flavodoxin reductase [Pedobacter changchengzhani]
MAHTVKITSVEKITPDVLRIVAEKPATLTFKPGQAVDLSINRVGWEKEIRPFTFTSLPDDNEIEFTIKSYPEHKGVTEQLQFLTKGDELILGDVFGDISYKNEGIFIAGGAGITPFIAIFKALEKENKIGNNKLLFANKTRADIILEKEFDKLLGKNFINILSKEDIEGYEHGYISEDLIKKYSDTSSKYFYLCGPEEMMKAIEKQLASLGISADFIIKEGY